MPINQKSLLLRGVLIVAAIVAVAYGVLVWMRPSVPVARVKAGTAINAVSGSVNVEAEYTMELKGEVPGRVIQSNMELDKRVKAGDVLVQLDTGDLLLDLEKTEAEYQAAKDRMKIGSPVLFQIEAAKEALTNAERQFKAGLLPETDLKAQRRELEKTEQAQKTEGVADSLTLETYENSIKLKKRQVEKMTIRAPFDGVIAQVYTRKGDLIASGAAICRLISISRTVAARISEENIAGVKVGQKAFVQFLPYDIQQFDAKVEKVMSTADPDTQRYVVNLDVQIDPKKLLPGITGEVSIILDERPSRTLIPRRALIGNEVFVVDDGKVERRKVKVGYQSMTAVEVLEGVSEGDWVVVDGFDQLRDGRSVRMEPVEDPKWR